MSEIQYLNMLKDVMENGTLKKNRTGIDTKSLFGYQIRFDLSQGFPLLTTKKVHLKSITHELLWFLRGDTNIKYLKDNGVTIWDEWADKNGDLGPVYGFQWRNFGERTREGYETEICFKSGDSERQWTPGVTFSGVDQIHNLICDIKETPFSRRLIVSAWNPVDIPKMHLPPCHCLFQFNVRPDKDGKPEYLDCQLYQRSADIFLGVPFNIASYAMLTMMIAQVCDLKPGHFVHSFGDVHLYVNHEEQARVQLSREIRTPPKLIINKQVKDVFKFRYEDFSLEDYNPWPTLKAEIAV